MLLPADSRFSSLLLLIKLLLNSLSFLEYLAQWIFLLLILMRLLLPIQSKSCFHQYLNFEFSGHFGIVLELLSFTMGVYLVTLSFPRFVSLHRSECAADNQFLQQKS